MIDIDFLRQHPQEVENAVRARGVTDADVSKVIALDKEWRELTQEVETFRREHNVQSQEVVQLSGREKDKQVEQLRKLRDELRKEEERLKEKAQEREALLRRIPNLPLPGVPEGKSETENRVDWESPKPSFSFQPRDYLDIATSLGIIDMERAARASGSRFGALIGDGALLEFALVQLAFDTLTREGFIPVIPPVLLKREGMAAMGYLERGEEEVYKTQDDLYLVGTSEQSIGAMHQGEEFQEADLPRRYVAFSSCFRREAGSYGKDTRGIIRVHQFDKVEMFSFCHPEASEEEHAFIVQKQRALIDALKIPYRVVTICTGDLSDPAAKTIDIEAWLPGSGEFRETHSASNTTDFQTRRLNVTYRDKEGKRKLAHAINGTAFANRTIIAIIENCQGRDGSVSIPSVLRRYLGKRKKLSAVA